MAKRGGKPTKSFCVSFDLYIMITPRLHKANQNKEANKATYLQFHCHNTADCMKVVSLIHTRRKRHSSRHLTFTYIHECCHYDHNTITSLYNKFYEPPHHWRLSGVNLKANLKLQCRSEAWEHRCWPFDP